MTEPTELPPTPGSRWTHRNGAPYTVLMIANVDTQDEARYPVTVVYQGDNGKVWSRPASDWHRSMTAAPQPTQAQAGAVPLTDSAARSLVWSASDRARSESINEDDVLEIVRATEAAHGIKGGQHGADA